MEGFNRYHPSTGRRCKTCFREEGTLLKVPGVHHRKLVEVITTGFQDEAAKKFHNVPHHLYWKPTPESEPKRVITDSIQMHLLTSIRNF